jgi:hypothetical protein
MCRGWFYLHGLRLNWVGDPGLDLGRVGGVGPGNPPLWWRKPNLEDSSISQQRPGVQINLGKGAGSLTSSAHDFDVLPLPNIPAPVFYAAVIGTFDHLPVRLGRMIPSV